jgi:predicted PurR-regulated permease PerM
MDNSETSPTPPPPPANETNYNSSANNKPNNWASLARERAQFEPGAKLPVQEIHFSTWAKRTTVFLLAGLLIIFLLQVADVLPPFIWAVVTAFVLNRPLGRLVHRTGWPRWSWAAIFYLIFFLALTVVVLLVVPNVQREITQLNKDAPNIQRQIDDYLNNNDNVEIGPVKISTETARNLLNSAVTEIPKRLQELAPTVLSKTFRVLIDFLLYLVVTFYLMLSGGAMIFHGLNTLPLQYRGEIRNLVLRVDRVLSAYIRGQFILIGIMSVAAFIILTVLGVPYAFVLAIMTGVLELIPFIGPYLAMAIAGAVAYFAPNANFHLSGFILTAIVVALYFIVRQIEDYVVVPAIIGKIVELPPIMVIFAVLAGAALLGPMGLLLAVPITATVKIIAGYLLYKLVDADREKIDLRGGSSIEEITQLLETKANGRVLLEVDHHAEYLHDKQSLERLKQLEHDKQIDIAIDTGDEKLAHMLRNYGFPIVTIAQEHFPGNRPN